MTACSKEVGELSSSVQPQLAHIYKTCIEEEDSEPQHLSVRRHS